MSSRKPRGHRLPGLLLVAAILAVGMSLPKAADAPPTAQERYNRPTRDWYEGPVRYLLSGEEEKDYRARTTEADRERFIEDFWARRDDAPATPPNEFEIRFWKRVEEADRLFQDAPYPGWKTDRGKIYVLLGPPDEIRQGMASSSLGKDIPYAIWLYHQPRFEGMERDTEIRFVRDDSGEMKMTDQLFASRLERLSGMTRSLSYGVAAAQQPPQPTQLLDAIAAAKPAMDTGRFHTHYDFFLAADGSTSVVLTLGIRPETPAVPTGGAPPPAAPSGLWKIYARLSNSSGSYDLVEPDSFRTSDLAKNVDGFELYQGRVSAPPGLYTVFYGIQDAATGELFSLGDRVQVPDYAGKDFSLTSVTLADRLEPAENPKAGDPFLVGRMTVVPKMDPVYKPGNELAYYFQVYHPQPDPATGQARLDLTYSFFRAEALKKTGNPAYSPLGKPVVFEDQTGQVHGYAVPLTGWPPGEYKVLVQVHDRVADRTVQAEARFSVK